MNDIYRYSISLIARAKNERIENFSDEEIKRVFKNTAHETKNIKEFKALVRMGLSFMHIYMFNEIQLLRFLKGGKDDSF